MVTVESETDPRIKKTASKVEYLPYGHVDILGQDKTVTETLKFLGSNPGQ